MGFVRNLQKIQSTHAKFTSRCSSRPTTLKCDVIATIDSVVAGCALVLRGLGYSASLQASVHCSIARVAFWAFIHVRMATRQVEVQCRPMLAINVYSDMTDKK